jgi:hypothetical protein
MLARRNRSDFATEFALASPSSRNREGADSGMQGQGPAGVLASDPLPLVGAHSPYSSVRLSHAIQLSSQAREPGPASWARRFRAEQRKRSGRISCCAVRLIRPTTSLAVSSVSSGAEANIRRVSLENLK